LRGRKLETKRPGEGAVTLNAFDVDKTGRRPGATFKSHVSLKRVTKKERIKEGFKLSERLNERVMVETETRGAGPDVSKPRP